MKKRIWSKQELTVAYYLTKYGMSNLGVKFEDIAGGVIPDTTQASLNMQMANFRHILDIEGMKLEDTSKAMRDLCEELKDSTITQVRKQVLDTIEKSEVTIKVQKISKHNQQVLERRDKLNQEANEEFDRKMKYLRKYRNLRSK